MALEERKFIGHFRVSTERQGHSGLGLDAQRASVAAYLSGGHGELTEAFTEIETGKGAKSLDKRPQLRAALDMCRKVKATLVIAKLDRLARNVHVITGLIESGVDFVAVDMPQANKTMLQMHAVMAEWEADCISRRTREALAAAKARGVILGATGPSNLRNSLVRLQSEADAFAAKMRDVLLGLKARNLSQREIAKALNGLGIKSPRGGEWHLITVQRVFARLGSK
jgi:DNA invertase Pin-like site-specific DNA recombinase